MDIVRFYVSILKIAFALAAVGQLKTCTLAMMGMAAEHHEMISYSKFTRMLTESSEIEVAHKVKLARSGNYLAKSSKSVYSR